MTSEFIIVIILYKHREEAVPLNRASPPTGAQKIGLICIGVFSFWLNPNIRQAFLDLICSVVFSILPELINTVIPFSNLVEELVFRVTVHVSGHLGAIRPN